MKKWMILALAVLLVLPGCGKKEEAEPAETPPAASEQQTETTPDTPAEDGQQQDEQSGKAQQPATSLPTGEELADMIEQTNDPDISEAEKRELLDQIDAILKQAEAQVQ